MKHRFLALFGGVAAAFAAQNATASIQALNPTPQIATTNVLNVIAPDGQVIVHDRHGDEFEFVLKNSGQTGLMMAGHRSHRSHSSHRSHYSSR
ncbi:His-Xaa-Ser repeat protein HxsA2 [Limnohabitans sp.]|uniref:His-Xaa-Ser repeat protein HxsA2 n=1 Tax=Limnohabitans sp. TaxID=1907725 RepID=UPI0038BB2DB8